MATETLDWNGITTIELNGIEYVCDFDCEVQVTRYTQRHEPFYSEPMADALVMLGAFEAECGGKPVDDAATRKELRSRLIEWVSDHESEIVNEAK